MSNLCRVFVKRWRKEEMINYTVESPRDEKLVETPDYEPSNGVSRFGITVNPLNGCNSQPIHRAYLDGKVSE